MHKIVFLLNLCKAFSRKRRCIKKIAYGRERVCLEIGSSEVRPGWFTMDIGVKADIHHDLLKGIPLPDNSVDQLYCSHLLEHFSYRNLIELLGACKRVLKPGGSFKISVPNAEIYLKAYSEPEKFSKDKYCVWKPGLNYFSPIDYVNYMAYMEGEDGAINHRHLFDEKNIVGILKTAGFKDVGIRDFEPGLDPDKRRYESIYVSCTK